MARLKVFLSSTCYDYGIVRAQLRNFISDIGFEPVLSEFSDVLFDPRIHTQGSCIKEIEECDMLILLIGSRFGGEVVPSVIQNFDFAVLGAKSSNTNLLDQKEHVSITQLEVLQAIKSNLPVYAFVDSRVYHDHCVYQKNGKTRITYPSIDRQDTAEYIFEFINYIRHQNVGNALIPFSRLEEIEAHLKSQWSALFQRLLQEVRQELRQERRIDELSNQIQDVKTMLLTSIADDERKGIAKSTIRFRRLVEFLLSFRVPNTEEILLSSSSWRNLLTGIGINRIFERDRKETGAVPRTILQKSDGTFYELRAPSGLLERYATDWDEFCHEPLQARKAIISAVRESSDQSLMFGRVRYIQQRFEDYVMVLAEDSEK